MKLKKLLFTLLMVGLLLVACSSKPSPQISQALEEESYPVSDYSNLIGTGYPVEDTEHAQLQSPAFIIQTPVKADDEVVRGTGPAGVPIILISVSDVGDVLGETTIDADGVFSFTLNAPLTSGQIIGLQLGDITGTEFSEGDFLYSDTYFEHPLVGLMFDKVVVE